MPCISHPPLWSSCAGDAVLSIEQRGFNAWPARHTVLLDGWLLRAAGGYTKRANSANAMQAGARLGPLLPGIEDFHARLGLPAIFRLSPLASREADDQLARAGYRSADPSLLMGRDLDGMHAPPALPPGLGWHMRCSPGAAWLRGLADASALTAGQQALHAAMLESIAWPAAFAWLERGGVAAAFGLAVLERGAVGLYDIAVVPPMRGQGLGRALVQGLLHWAQGQGARSAQLQVREPNEAARTLYEGLGFRDLYAYHYRLPPTGADPIV